MTVIALTSAAGSPGATTAAVCLAVQWPRPVLLVEADTWTSSPILAGYYEGRQDYTTGLIDLAYAHASGQLAHALTSVSIPLQAPIGPEGTNSSAAWIPGLASAAQAATIGPIWGALSSALRDLSRTAGIDIIIDAGRLGQEFGPTPLLMDADLVLLATQTSLRAIAAANRQATLLTQTLGEKGTSGASAALLLIGPRRLTRRDRPPYSDGEIRKVIDLPIAASLPWDPPSAAVYSDGRNASTDGRRGRFSGELNRHARAAADSFLTMAEAKRASLGGAA